MPPPGIAPVPAAPRGALLAGPSKPVDAIRAQYEAWPYPRVPRVGRVRTAHTWQLNASYLADRCGVAPPGPRPRVWVAGCGTLQPYVFALANPGARILCTDLSQRSLDIAQGRCRWHGQRDVDFARVDLEDPTQWPDGPFDLIECYGVLMNLSDPAATLAALRARLAPGGVLRIMVYTHFGRRRIHQVQRLARLLGLHAGDRRHPRRLRCVVRGLPRDHPLRFTFDSYPDSANPEGIVDGFLHASDRGFTGLGLGEIVARAGLRPAFWFHRPWGQPDGMAAALGLDGWAQSRVLHYLDLWQELRTNFVVCLVRDDARAPLTDTVRPHPLFDAATPGLSLRHRVQRPVRWLRGERLPSRTAAAPLAVPGRAFRTLERLDGPDLGVLLREGLVLGGSRPGGAKAAHDPAAAVVAPTLPDDGIVDWCEEGPVPNPLYAALFAAWSCHLRWPEFAPGDLANEIDRWRRHAAPLEDRSVPIGLTPIGTYRARGAQIDAWLERWQPPTRRAWADVRLPDEAGAFAAVEAFLRGLPFDPPRPARAPEELRELWVLLFSHRQLFLPAHS